MRILSKLLIFVFLFLNIEMAFSEENSIVLPLRFYSGNPSPYGMASTEVKIGDKKIPLIIDLGASLESITLFPLALKQTSYRLTHKKVTGHTFSGKMDLEEIILPTISLGKVTLHNVVGQAAEKLWDGEKSPENLGAMRYGLLGLQFFKQFGVLFDYSHHKIILTKNNRLPSGYRKHHWIAIPFEYQGGIMTKFQINHQKSEKFVWDTGAVPSVIDSEYHSGIAPKSCPKELPYSQEKDCQTIQAKNFSYKNKELPGIWFKLRNFHGKAPFVGLIGDNYFRDNIIFIDFKQQRIFILVS